MRKLLIILTILSFLSYEAIGQINLKTGFGAVYFSGDVHQNILNQYDSEHPELLDGFDELKFMYGINIGLRYNLGSTALEFTYQNLNNSLMASGMDVSDIIFEKKLYYIVNGYSIGMSQRVGVFDCGATIGYDYLTIKTKSNLMSEKSEILNDYALNSKFFLSLHLSESDNLEIVLRPYVNIFWDSYYLGNLNQELNGSSEVPQSNYLGKFKYFGLSLIIYNGPI